MHVGGGGQFPLRWLCIGIDIPLTYSSELDLFHSYYVNKYSDHYAFEIAISCIIKSANDADILFLYDQTQSKHNQPWRNWE